MAEWFNAPVLKTDVLKGTGGSNPSPSAKYKMHNVLTRKPHMVHGFCCIVGNPAA